MNRTVKRVILLAVLLIVPVIANAQQATITGVVTDASGGVLPGVTVEASSPVLIEKGRSAVTDGTGQFRIVSLPSGTYTASGVFTPNATWPTPTAVLQARLARISVTFDW
jgi:hypothetical protein